MRALACGAGGAAQGPGGSFERVPFRYAAQQALAERQATESARASARSGVAVTGPAGSPASGLPALTLSTPIFVRSPSTPAWAAGRLVGVVALEASFQRVVDARRLPPAAFRPPPSARRPPPAAFRPPPAARRPLLKGVREPGPPVPLADGAEGTV
jgi:hypothetical protein